MSEQVITVTLTGVERASANLKYLEQKAIRRVVTASVRAGLKVLVIEARDRAPRKTGKLRKNVRAVSVQRDRTTGTITGKVAAKATKRQREKGLGAYYGHMVMGGTKPHEIHVRVAGAMTIGGGKVMKVVMHPGARPNDFMGEAARSGYRRAVQAFERKANEATEKELAKLPK